MAIVGEYRFPGAKVIVRDDSYRDATPEEIQRRIQHAHNVAQGIMLRYAARVAAGEQEPIDPIGIGE